MITVLIVEDERLELNALEKAIDYTSLGMQVIGTASNGEFAMNLLKKHQPDILITDIVMPKLSGLELLKYAKELRPDMYVLIISGHQRFDYAQLALEYEATCFLTKPLLPEQLFKYLKNISLEIQKKNRQRFEEEFFVHELNNNLPLLRELFVQSIIEGNIPSDIKKRFSFYNIPLEDSFLTALCILPEEKNDISMLSLRHCVTSFFEAKELGYCFASFSSVQNEVLCVLIQCNTTDSPDTICDLAEQLRMAILTDSGFSVTIGTSSIGNGWKDIPSCAANAKQALEYRFYLGTGQVIAFHDVSTEKHIGSPQLIRQLFSPLLAASDEGDSDALEQLCNKLYHEASTCSLSPRHLQILFTELMSRIISSRYKSDLNSLERDDISSIYTKMLSTETLEDMVNQVRQELNTTKKSVDKYMSGREEWLVQKIKEFIKSHYSENLTIDTIARQIFISSGYATRLFRKHTGESINNYITQIRMMAAADLLKDPSAIISEVAAKTGYTNIAYFSSVFRKKYNCTPREYRDIHAGAYTK